MHFYLPRRHRRRLLLPPGLLALAGLLLLGCLALRPWHERLTRWSALQLTMPIRFRPGDSKSIIRNYVPNPDMLRRHCFWYQTNLTGIAGHDSLLQQQIVGALRRIAADSLHDGVLSVQLGPKARYANLVYLLDLMLHENVTHYWLDITRQPVSFYVLQRAYRPQLPMLMCGTDGHPVRMSMAKQAAFGIRFDNWVTEFWQLQWFRQLWQAKQAQLRQPEWRLPLALLALLFLLNFRRLLTHQTL